MLFKDLVKSASYAVIFVFIVDGQVWEGDKRNSEMLEQFGQREVSAWTPTDPNRVRVRLK